MVLSINKWTDIYQSALVSLPSLFTIKCVMDNFDALYSKFKRVVSQLLKCV